MSDPEWLIDRTLMHVGRSGGRPWLGVVFFSTPHFPYVAPYPDYLWRAENYLGPYLYHAPPAMGERVPAPGDVEQVRARYDEPCGPRIAQWAGSSPRCAATGLSGAPWSS